MASIPAFTCDLLYILARKYEFGTTLLDIATAKRKLFNLQLHHRMSKFEVPVVVNLKHIFLTFWALYHLLFDLETIEVN